MEFLHRNLEEENNATTTTDDDDVGGSDETELIDGNDSVVLKNTLRLYGTFFVCVLILFSYLRRKFPKIYNLRSWVEDLQTPLAKEKHGFFNWMVKVLLVTDSEMMDECGMDAMCFIRVLGFGIKLSFAGMINAVWLIPVYYTAEKSPETDYITDPVVSISVSHLPSGSYRFIATVIGAYIIFGFAMYCMLSEFKWYFLVRNQFMAKKLPRNYSVYVRNIPAEYCTDDHFQHFWNECSSGSVLETRLAIKAPNLKKLVAKREQVISKLEHKINVEEIKGKTPMQMNLDGSRVNAISSLFGDLQELNQNISQSIDGIIERRSTTSEDMESGKTGSLENLPIQLLLAQDSREMTTMSFETESDFVALPPPVADFPNENTVLATGEIIDEYYAENPTDSAQASQTTNPAKRVLGSANVLASSAIKNVADTAKGILAQEDGESLTAGFVTFKTLLAVQAAKQMIQDSEPFEMEVLEAPQPEGKHFNGKRCPPNLLTVDTANHYFLNLDVFWANVGRTHRDLQFGMLLSMTLTTLLCLFWTIPMSFISSLSSVEGLKGQFEWIAEALEAAPWLEPFLEQLAPLILIVANEALKMILELLSTLEGPVSGAVVIAATFRKLAAFMIIQTFFVSTLSGSIFDELSNIAQDPTLVVDLLANSLPTQSTFFIQLIIVDTAVGLGMELLRVSAVAQASIRRCIGPNLTEKERNASFLGIRPLADPLEFEHDSVMSTMVLYFLVYFVYATIAPITTFFTGICFFIMGICYRHQFIYIFPTFPDSGGKLWVSFIKIVPISMIIAQVTIIGLLALKRTPVASAMMFPLLVITILFYVYISQQHFRVAEFLPVRDCRAIDRRNTIETMSHDSLRCKYVQPELGEREAFPENMSPDREVRLGVFATPPGSEQGDFENIDGA